MRKPGKRSIENIAGSAMSTETQQEDMEAAAGVSTDSGVHSPSNTCRVRRFLPGSHQLSQKRRVSNSQVISTPARSSHGFSAIRNHGRKVRLPKKW